MIDPSREEVERNWRALIDGTLSREEVHRWTLPWVEGSETPHDPLVNTAVQSLHGFDLSSPIAGESRRVHHGLEDGWEYIRSMADIASELNRWLGNLEAFDRDPQAWRRERFTHVRDALVAQGTTRWRMRSKRESLSSSRLVRTDSDTSRCGRPNAGSSRSERRRPGGLPAIRFVHGTAAQQSRPDCRPH
jgi:hypothetical protein